MLIKLSQGCLVVGSVVVDVVVDVVVGVVVVVTVVGFFVMLSLEDEVVLLSEGTRDCFTANRMSTIITRKKKIFNNTRGVEKASLN